jgi:hypothetical protein
MSTDKKQQPGMKEEMNADISPAERSLLDQSFEDTMLPDAELPGRSALDTTDDEGEPLNVESTGETGEDLDIPGAELDDEYELLGEEDEENNGYSEADTE